MGHTGSHALLSIPREKNLVDQGLHPAMRARAQETAPTLGPLALENSLWPGLTDMQERVQTPTTNQSDAGRTGIRRLRRGGQEKIASSREPPASVCATDASQIVIRWSPGRRRSNCNTPPRSQCERPESHQKQATKSVLSLVLLFRGRPQTQRRSGDDKWVRHMRTPTQLARQPNRTSGHVQVHTASALPASP